MLTPGDSIIYAKRPFDQVRPASTTKVMTAILGLEAPDLEFDYIVPQWVEEDVARIVVTSSALRTGGEPERPDTAVEISVSVSDFVGMLVPAPTPIARMA